MCVQVIAQATLKVRTGLIAREPQLLMSRQWSGCCCYIIRFILKAQSSTFELFNARPLLFEWSFVWGCMFVRQWTFVIAISFVIGVGVGVQLPTRTVTPPSAPARIEAYFTPDTECEDRIIAELGRATTIDIAVYSITNPKIADAIIAAHQRGASVRIVTDRTMAGHKSSMIDELAAAGIPVRTNRRYKIEHNKFAVFDNRRMVTGSYNWTTAATKYNSENCIFLTHPVQKYSKRFEYLWNAYKK